MRKKLFILLLALLGIGASYEGKDTLLGAFSTMRGFTTLQTDTPCSTYLIPETSSNTLDWNNGCVQQLELDTSLTFTSWSNGVSQGRMFLIVTASGSSPGTITWPSSVKWASTSGSNDAPSLSGARTVDIFEFFAVSSGSYYGVYEESKNSKQ